jgi:hypothetical protein
MYRSGMGVSAYEQKEITGNPVRVAGHFKDVFGNAPSERVRKEGGYEGRGHVIHDHQGGRPGCSVSASEGRDGHLIELR